MNASSSLCLLLNVDGGVFPSLSPNSSASATIFLSSCLMGWTNSSKVFPNQLSGTSPGLSGTLFHEPSSRATAHLFTQPGMSPPYSHLSLSSIFHSVPILPKWHCVLDLPVFIIYCFVTNDHKFSDLKKHTHLLPHSFWGSGIWAQLGWALGFMMSQTTIESAGQS